MDGWWLTYSLGGLVPSRSSQLARTLSLAALAAAKLPVVAPELCLNIALRNGRASHKGGHQSSGGKTDHAGGGGLLFSSCSELVR